MLGVGFSSCDLRAPECAGSVVVTHGLSCPTACGILITQPGIKPTFPALEDGFLTNGPPVQFSSVTQYCLFGTPWTAAPQASPSITNSRSLLKFISIKSVMPFNHLILCYPLLLPSILPSIRVFSSESVLHITWPKYWSFSFSLSPSNEYSGLLSFRNDWFHLLAVQGTLKSLLQHHSSKAPILRRSAFFTVQLSHPYIYFKYSSVYLSILNSLTNPSVLPFHLGNHVSSPRKCFCFVNQFIFFFLLLHISNITVFLFLLILLYLDMLRLS